MALVRCEKHSKPNRRSYIKSVKPLNYPNSSAICGRPDCNNVGLVWLKDEQWGEYQNGTRIFTLYTNAIKVKVE